ncbi:hypothetical protein [Crocinitomix algicola]|uniref:hypothetical protein n=1 Tax=Crocinitomix algicola TaxID=1740263 RepID=UPI001C30FE13|nr:hypothetical protein [Crocinitomix algicola]
MTAVTLIAVVVFIIIEGFNSWGVFLLVPVLTAFMALTRRFLRKKLEKSEAERDARNKK